MIYAIDSDLFRSFISSKSKNSKNFDHGNSKKEKIKEKGAGMEDGRSG